MISARFLHCKVTLSLCCLFFSRSVLSDSAIPWTASCQASLSLTIPWSLLEHIPIESIMPPNHLVFCHPRLLPPIFLSIRVFSNELALPIRWPKYWNFSISPANEYSGLISFRTDWFGLLATQGTFKCLLKHCSLKASVLQCSTLFMVHPSMTTGKTTALTILFGRRYFETT